MNRTGDTRRGQSLDGAGREAALELPGAEQYLEAPPRESHAHTAVVFRVRRRLDQPFGLESLDEGRGGRAGHAQLGGELLGAGIVPAPQVEGHQSGPGAGRNAVRAEHEIPPTL